MSSSSNRQSSASESGSSHTPGRPPLEEVGAEKEELIKKLAAKFDAAQLRHLLAEGEHPSMRNPPSPMPLERDRFEAHDCPEHVAINAEFEKHAAALGYADRQAV